jgi:hypothetical protein
MPWEGMDLLLVRPGTAIGNRGKPWPPRDPKTLRLLKLK